MNLVFVLLGNALSKVYTSCQKAGQIAMTFDDGPSPYTGTLLDSLKEAEVKAAFHFVGDYLETPYVAAYAREAYENGHLIGLNSKVSLDKLKSKNDTYFDDLIKLQEDIQNVVGFKPTFLRVPYSTRYPEEIVEKLEDMGFTITAHNLDSQDYLFNKKQNDKDGIYKNIKEQIDQIVAPAKGSFILVQHDSVAPSVNQTPLIVDYLKDKKYDIVRLDEAIGKKAAKEEVTVTPKAENIKKSSFETAGPSLVALFATILFY